MREASSLVWSVLVLLFQSRASLKAEILMLRHQLNGNGPAERDRLNLFVSWKLTAPDPFLSRCQRLCLLLLLWACGQRVSVVHHVHSLRGLHPFAPDRHRRAIAECLMRANSCLGLAAVGIALEIDVL